MKMFKNGLTWGNLEKREEVRSPEDPEVPLVVSPLGLEPKKPRGLWDARYVNEFCRDIPFTMDKADKVAEISWFGSYLFKLDHKMDIFMSHCIKILENSLGYSGKACTMS